ncbi:MAG TPA: phosphatidylcholine synthase [Xanthobacteraceae bacterium]|nr:phosphatidylcholine synthase [Xanthobacteraceae bacterium]
MANAAEPLEALRLKRARALAFCVHLLTAFGAVTGLLALIAAINHDWPIMFAWLAASLMIDAIDGAFARRLRVAEVLPRWSGEILDLVVDFLNYVTIPALAIIAGGFMRPSLAIAAAAAILISSAIYFADSRMKTDDAYFRGFPATWNLIAFYFFLLRPSEWMSLFAITVLVVCTFLPFVFVHPMRVRRFRALNILLCALWGALAIFALIRNFAPPLWVTYALAAIAIYFLIAGLSRSISRTS